MTQPDLANISPGPRIDFLDISRFLGMILVYYGHIMEQFMYLGNTTAGAQYKYIYTFHMAFFFLLSGWVHNPAKLRQPGRKFLAYEAASRLVPYVTFSLLMCATTLLFTGWFPLGELSTAQSYWNGFVNTLRGFPAFNVPTWFLAMLITTELLHRLVGRFLESDVTLVVAAVLFYLGGYWLNNEVSFVIRKDGPSLNFWFVHEAPVVYAFFLVGVLLRRHSFLYGRVRRAWLLTGAALCALVVLLTFNLNQGPWRLIPAVVIVLSGHGHIFWFPFTALVGSLMMLLLAKACDPGRWLAWMGKNTLVIFCLNGVFYHYVNPRFAKWFMALFEPSWWSVTLSCVTLTALSLALCVPVVVCLTRWLPQLVGRPSQQGPLLPRLVRPSRHVL